MDECDSSQQIIAKLRAQVNALTRPSRVLFVEDDPTVKVAFVALTEKYNCATDFAATFKLGLELAYSGKDYDLIFLDRRLPDGDGIELFRIIRKVRPLRASVVMLSGYIDADMADAIAEIGYAAMITKPGSFTQDFFDWLLPTFSVRLKFTEEY